MDVRTLGRCALALVLSVAPAASIAQGPTELQPRPFPMGVSVSTAGTGATTLFAGTAGGRVQSLVNPSLKFILSNNHVIASGGDPLCPNGAPQLSRVVQPGTLDIGFDPGTDPTFLAGLRVAAVPIEFGLFSRNTVDAALAFTVPEVASNEILGIGVPTAALARPVPDMEVIKSGRTSGVTTGVVRSVNATVLVSYDPAGSPGACGLARFVGQVIVDRNLGEAGDSGSLVLERATLAPVGLYFAGSPFFGAMNDILWVYLSLGVFVDGAPAPAAAAASAAPQTRQARRARERAMAAIAAIQARHQDRLLARPGVVGVGIGASDDGRDLVLDVYVHGRGARARAALPAALDGARVRLVDAGGPFRAR